MCLCVRIVIVAKAPLPNGTAGEVSILNLLTQKSFKAVGVDGFADSTVSLFDIACIYVKHIVCM